MLKQHEECLITKKSPCYRLKPKNTSPSSAKRQRLDSSGQHASDHGHFDEIEGMKWQVLSGKSISVEKIVSSALCCLKLCEIISLTF